jgi:hypothetical protein
MKHLILFSVILFLASPIFSQGVGVNNTGAAPNANAMLDVDATTNNKGILIPRITSGQRAGIGGLGAAEEGLTVYDETTNSYWLWDGTQWLQFMMQGKAWELAGNAGTTPGTDFIGTTDAQDWVIKTNNTERVRVLSNGDVDLNDNTMYERNTAGNTFGIGMNIYGGAEMVIFTDNLLDFIESDGNTPVMQIQANNNRIEMFGNGDATGVAGSGVLEIANALRIDGNEIITNTNTTLHIQNDNNGDVSMDAGTFHLDASTNRIGIGTTTPAYTIQTLVGGTVSVNDGYVRQVRALYLQDWDDNTGGTDDKYRLLGRDGAWQFYNGGVAVGSYPDGTWGDLAGGQLIVQDRIGIATTAPSTTLDVNGTVRIRGGGPSVGAFLMANNADGTATWSNSGCGLVPIGSIVAWHKNAAGVPGLPVGWVECNGGTSNGIPVPNLNGSTTSTSSDASLGRFLRGSTTSGTLQSDRSNNLDWVNHDDTGSNDVEEFINDDGTTTTIRNTNSNGDRFQIRVEGVETRVVNMSVVWIIRTQ